MTVGIEEFKFRDDIALDAGELVGAEPTKIKFFFCVVIDVFGLSNFDGLLEGDLLWGG